ncbi:hypothetical protein [Leptospira noguchii]|uniref:hypothetical protein n=1 Tax=Leptospira noguchii TaxID=28182 RepID=UPI0002BE19BB|nr:hypothetical protein [Leptospira noguchii]EMO29892.1 hypothetical protein LEP1GSC170_5504 [Leptospira interrogans serovar Bataviae str. HAI135]UOG47606.1 hypothetical protein MAL00_11010 [Leptospira noguchii]UOG53953.1 hypothetical protein MAL09_07600 [Leptospira noguchii]
MSSGKRCAEFDFDSKILFNLWVRLWLSMNRVVGWELSFTERFVVIPTDLY